MDVSQALPISFIKPLVEVLSNEHDIVLDPFMGSGTTAVVCRELNRKFIGFEINKAYVDMAYRRLDTSFSSVNTILRGFK